MVPQAKFKAVDVLMELADKSKEQAASILRQWQDNDVLTSIAYKTPTRNNASRIVLNEAKVAEILAPFNTRADAQ